MMIRSEEYDLHVVEIPAANAWARVLLLHGYGEHSGRHLHFLNWLAERGVASVTFDFRGQGQSTGKRGFVQNWTDYGNDVDAVLKNSSIAKSDLPRFLIAHSHGGLIAIECILRGMFDSFHGAVLTSPYLRNRLIIPAWKRLTAKIFARLAPGLGIPSGLSQDMMTHDPAMVADSDADPLIARVATPGWYAQMLKAQVRLFAQAESIRLPLLTLTGSEDPIADHNATAEFAKRVQGRPSQHHEYAGLRHEILRELRRQEVFDDIERWMLNLKATRAK